MQPHALNALDGYIQQNSGMRVYNETHRGCH